MVINFEISDESFELLLYIKVNRIAEYRDPEYSTLEEFKNSSNQYRTEEWFLDRNSNGTLYLVPELQKYNLIKHHPMAWHITYILSEFGEEVVSTIQREIKINELLED